MRDVRKATLNEAGKKRRHDEEKEEDVFEKEKGKRMEEGLTDVRKSPPFISFFFMCLDA